MFEEAAYQLSRRSLLASMLSTTLSKLFIRPDALVAAQRIPAGVNPAEGERIRRLCGMPIQWFKPVRTLMWTEISKTDGDDPHPMIWTPETPAEHAEADRLFRAGTWRSWSDDADLADLVRGSNRWLVRLRLVGGLVLFAAQGAAEAVADDEIDLTPNPAEAAVVTAPQALALIARLHVEYSVPPGFWLYFEPVCPDNPLADPRWDFLQTTA